MSSLNYMWCEHEKDNDIIIINIIIAIIIITIIIINYWLFRLILLNLMHEYNCNM